MAGSRATTLAPRRGALLRPRALACDFDGTLASADAIAGPVKEALHAARRSGIRLILITGRTFFDLTRVCDCLELFEVVVAENGAVLYWPTSGALRCNAPPPPEALRRELDRRGVAYQLGHVVVGATRGDEPAIRAALAASGVSLEIVYNRGFLMLLPTGVDKGSGIRRALQHLGLSHHDVLAIGDAENDLALFAACGWSACPGSAESAALRAADWIFPGHDGDAIAAALVGPITTGLPIGQGLRHRIQIGWHAATAAPMSLPARGANILIHGDSASGKSWLAGALVEQVRAQQYSVCVVDPEGDYATFDRSLETACVDVDALVDIPGAIDRLERDPGACVVLDLADLSHPGKLEAVRLIFRLLRAVRRRTGSPHWIVLDEAHYYLHPEGVSDEDVAMDEGGICALTYRPSWLRPTVVEAMDVVISARTTETSELAFVTSRFLARAGHTTSAEPAIADLPVGRFVITQANEDGRLSAATFVPIPRATPHIRHRTKYADAVVETDRQFLFRARDGRTCAQADSLGAFCRELRVVSREVLGDHAQRGDFSRWVLDVFGDRDLARQIAKVESRWRRCEVDDLDAAICPLIAARYGTSAPAHSDRAESAQ